jgi:hypothetical protein
MVREEYDLSLICQRIAQYTNMFPYTQVGNMTWHIITVPYFIAIAKPVTNNLLAKYNKTMK